MRKLSMDELNRKSVAGFKQAEKNPIVLVLDNIRSMHNVGSIFRTADAFLVKAIYLCGYTPKPPHRDINKTALGATETVDWTYFATTTEAVQLLQHIDYEILAIEQAENSLMLQDVAAVPGKNLALVFGNEVEGVSDAVLRYCHGCIEIPQLGMKHSLNVSVAAGIVLWEFVRKQVQVIPERVTPGPYNL